MGRESESVASERARERGGERGMGQKGEFQKRRGRLCASVPAWAAVRGCLLTTLPSNPAKSIAPAVGERPWAVAQGRMALSWQDTEMRALKWPPQRPRRHGTSGVVVAGV